MDDIFVASCNEMTVNITRFLIISKIVYSLFKCKNLPAKNEWWIKIKVSLIFKIIQWNCQLTKLKISNSKDLKDSIYFTLIWWEVIQLKVSLYHWFFFSSEERVSGHKFSWNIVQYYNLWCNRKRNSPWLLTINDDIFQELFKTCHFSIIDFGKGVVFIFHLKCPQ